MDRQKKINVLVADGTEKSLLSLSTLIMESDAVPVAARSGQEALGLLDSWDFALAVLDVNLPGRSAFELAEDIAGRPEIRDLPIVFTTDVEMDHEMILGAYEKGAVDVLRKPVLPCVLKKKVQFFTQLYRLKHAARMKVRSDSGEALYPLNRTVSELAGGIAHQFNNSLNIITGNVELLKMDLPGNRCVKQFSTAVFDSVKKMTALTDKLLAYARAGHHHPDQVEFNEVLKQVLSGLDRGGKHIRIETHLDSGLIQVDADRSHLKMVFSALLKNAVEAISDTGQITVKTCYVHSGESPLSHGDDAPNNLVCFEVVDDGQGMSFETRTRVFEPFFSTKFQGRGLDMAAVQGIVNNHNGFIDVDSSLGKGTRVRVFLPAIGYRKPSSFHLPDTRAKATGTVLVIDDDESLQGLTVTMLNRLGYQAITASTGKEAVETVRNGTIPIQLALLDVEMPDMKGNDIFPHLMSLRSDLKVVVCSGYSIDGPVQDLLTKGAHAFLQKPFSFGDLASLLQKLIERRRLKRYGVHDGFAVYSWGHDIQKNTVIDISQGGACIRGTGSPESLDVWRDLSIEAQNGAFQIKGIPFQLIPRSIYSQPAGMLPGREERLNLRFGELSPLQVRQMDHFIAHYTR